MTKTPPQKKEGTTMRQKRLGLALRENLRKRKSQLQKREKGKDAPPPDESKEES